MPWAQKAAACSVTGESFETVDSRGDGGVDWNPSAILAARVRGSIALGREVEVVVLGERARWVIWIAVVGTVLVNYCYFT